MATCQPPPAIVKVRRRQPTCVAAQKRTAASAVCASAHCVRPGLHSGPGVVYVICDLRQACEMHVRGMSYSCGLTGRGSAGTAEVHLINTIEEE